MLLNMQRGRIDEPRDGRLAFSVSEEKRERGINKGEELHENSSLYCVCVCWGGQEGV